MTLSIYHELVVLTTWLLRLGNSCILIQYDELPNDYLRWKAASSSNDPTTEYDIYEIQSLCGYLLLANNYVYLKNASTISILNEANLLEMVLVNEYHISSYTERNLVIGSVDEKVKMYPCAVSEENKTDFYLTYAYRKNHFLVLAADSSDNNSLTTIRGMLEPSPTIPFPIREEPKVIDSFWNIFRRSYFRMFPWFKQGEKVTLGVPQNMDLCSLTEYQHFNICSLVADQLYLKLEFTQLDIKPLNYIHNIPERCVTKTVKSSNKKKYKLVGALLPCSINSEDWSTPHFYLLRDPNESKGTSIFVFEAQEDTTLAVITRVDNVMV